MIYLKYIYKILLLSIISNVLYASQDDNIYTWRDSKGNVVFSQTAPMFGQEYEKVGVVHKNQIQQKSPVEQQLASLKQNNLYLGAHDTQQDNQQHSSRNSEVIKVKIISPANGENRFVHNEKLPIILEPTLTAEDHPIFVVNGIPYPAHFENGVWKINRPNPGPVTISVRGSTKDHKIITSSDSEFYRRQVLGR